MGSKLVYRSQIINFSVCPGWNGLSSKALTWQKASVAVTCRSLESFMHHPCRRCPGFAGDLALNTQSKGLSTALQSFRKSCLSSQNLVLSQFPWIPTKSQDDSMTLPLCSNRVAMCFFVLMAAYTALAVAKDSVMWGSKFIVKESDIALESPSGCQVLWTDILLNYNKMVPSEYSQLVSFRVDCRGAQGDSENLTLLDKTPKCTALH